MHREIALALFLVASCSQDTTEPRATQDGGRDAPTARSDGGGFPSLFGDGGIFSGAGRQQCPASKPTNGGACTEGRGDCMYGVDVCDCEEDKWACWNPADCPATAPAEGASCSVVGMQCSIEAQSDELDCDCTNAGWDCGRQVCPAAEPTSGGSCQEGDGQCTYGPRVCVCEDDVWACWNPADCPSGPPAQGAACSPLGMRCPYGNGACSCGDDGWECNRRVVRDAGAGDAGAAIVPSGLDSGV